MTHRLKKKLKRRKKFWS